MACHQSPDDKAIVDTLTLHDRRSSDRAKDTADARCLRLANIALRDADKQEAVKKPAKSQRQQTAKKKSA
jgi:hypothetical protein